MEGLLGVRLFDRNSQGAELTAHGEVLLAAASMWSTRCNRASARSNICPIQTPAR
jgi:DNA-binding transcriptional LysR family regulator